MTTARVIGTAGTAELVIRGSRFLARAEPIATRAEVDAVVAGLRSEHHRASHVCFAYRLGRAEVEEFSSDAGEPSGTAGKPLLDALRATGLRDALLTVVRYFGGTKLGIRGLIDAYGGAGRAALEAARIVTTALHRRWRAGVDYSQAGPLESRVLAGGGLWRPLDYGARIDVEVAFPSGDEEAASWLAELASAGALEELHELSGVWLTLED